EDPPAARHAGVSQHERDAHAPVLEVLAQLARHDRRQQVARRLAQPLAKIGLELFVEARLEQGGMVARDLLRGPAVAGLVERECLLKSACTASFPPRTIWCSPPPSNHGSEIRLAIPVTLLRNCRKVIEFR